jgi:sirohydrochlorin ferrochelatase
MMDAVIYIAHGSRTTEENSEFVSFIKRTMEKVEAPIQEYGFLEKAEPSISRTVKSCVTSGARNIKVIPVLLMPGIHANEDIPNELNEERNRYPGITFQYGKTLGADEIMAEIVYDRIIEKGYTLGEDASVLLVGHGSRDESAAREFESLAEMLEGKYALKVQTGYLKTAPFYYDMIAECRNKVYILPYFLFSGGFIADVQQGVSCFRNREIVLCNSIGAAPKLANLLSKRVNEILV